MRAALLVLALVLCCTVAQSEPWPRNSPQVEPQKQSYGSPKTQQDAKAEPQFAVPSGAARANENDSGASGANSKNEGTEFWPPFLGIRMRVTDSLLVLFTFVLAIFTGLLWNSTNKLWAAGERQLIISQRAFVFVSQFHLDIVPTAGHPAWWMSVDWKNSGSTPTKDFFNRMNAKTFVGEPSDDFSFPDQPGNDAIRGLIGPHGIQSSAILRIPIEVINGVRDKHRRLFVWGWAEYDDIFKDTAPHRTEFCDEIIIDPSGLPIRHMYRRHNGADNECDRKARPANERKQPIV